MEVLFSHIAKLCIPLKGPSRDPLFYTRKYVKFTKVPVENKTFTLLYVNRFFFGF